MAALTLDLGKPMTVVELSHEMERGMPNHYSHPAYDLVPYYRPGDFVLSGGYGGANELLLMSGHSGTHLDALGHVTRNGQGYGGLDTSSLSAGLDGLAHNGIDEVAPVLRRGVLLDCAAFRGGDVGPDRAITAEEVEALLEHEQLEIEAGDCVLIGTGWSRHWGSPADYMGESTGAPGIDVSAADYLCDRGAFLIGGETSVVEHQAKGNHDLPVHMRVLSERGVHLLENMNLGEIMASGARTFLFVCLPLRLKGATGSPVRAVAVLQ